MKRNFLKIIKETYCYFFHTNRKYQYIGTKRYWYCEKCNLKFKNNPVTYDTGPR